MSLFKRLYEKKQDAKSALTELDAFAREAKEFADLHPNVFILLADPQTDVVFTAHRGVMAPVRLLNPDGSRNFIVANALAHKDHSRDINRFLQIVDGCLYTIANTLYTIRRASLRGKVIDFVSGKEPAPKESVLKLEDGAMLSPVQLQ